MTEVIEQPKMVLCKKMYNGNEVLMPIHQKSLEKIDKKKKQVKCEFTKRYT